MHTISVPFISYPHTHYWEYVSSYIPVTKSEPVARMCVSSANEVSMYHQATGQIRRPCASNAISAATRTHHETNHSWDRISLSHQPTTTVYVLITYTVKNSPAKIRHIINYWDKTLLIIPIDVCCSLIGYTVRASVHFYKLCLKLGGWVGRFTQSKWVIVCN